MNLDFSKLLLISLSSLTLLGFFLYVCANNLFSGVKSLVISMKAILALILLLTLKQSMSSVSMLTFFVLLSGLFGLISIISIFIMNKINNERGDLDLDKNPELKN